MCLDLINSMSQQLRDTNLLHNNLAVNPSGSYLGLYQGLMYQEDKQLFSFVPCKPYKNGQVQSHERPILDRASFRLSGINQGYSHIEMTEDEGKEYWEEIVKVCICQGFSLGVSLALPPAFASTGVKNPSVAGDVSSACSAASS
jgi:hypothetical protein